MTDRIQQIRDRMNGSDWSDFHDNAYDDMAWLLERVEAFKSYMELVLNCEGTTLLCYAAPSVMPEGHIAIARELEDEVNEESRRPR